MQFKIIMLDECWCVLEVKLIKWGKGWGSTDCTEGGTTDGIQDRTAGRTVGKPVVQEVQGYVKQVSTSDWRSSRCHQKKSLN